MQKAGKKTLLAVAAAIGFAGCGNDAPLPPAPASSNAPAPTKPPVKEFAAPRVTAADFTDPAASPKLPTMPEYGDGEQRRMLTIAEIQSLTTAPAVSAARMQLEAHNDLPELEPYAADLPSRYQTPPTARLASNVATMIDPIDAIDGIDLDGPELSSSFDSFHLYEDTPSSFNSANRPRPARAWNGY
ncbi:hypothetical protein FACS1894139_13700 [Planctomycetales bacterium]|nr:hypothetical protein FACS1894107_06660 [Planctomycetales bacterium]GHS98596.1 hypothetical protein FACS1894108_07020 [Planctomycetales bacterium]GHT06857.1 hypothetical protein FACS1894139_13700 [Planctomycetales bacterium]GHV20077.1 hypothetical protein AGMMS49959_06610 [Planctomycetales bacterium]